MDDDHDRIEELLAGYVLLALSGEDAVEADRLLSEHVPDCPLCRDTMAGFQAVAGDLGLATAPVEPPELLLPRIRRSAERIPVRRRRTAGFAVVATGVAALVGLAGLSVSLGSRMSKVEMQRGRLLEAIQALREPGATPVTLQSQGEPAEEMVEVSRPTLERMYLIGGDVPAPARGRVYELWLGSSGTFHPVQAFMPEDNGFVALVFTVDVTRYDEILITEERLGERPAVPSSGGHVWHALLPKAA